MTENWKTKTAFLVLLAVKDNPKHGYEIANYIREKSGGYFSVSFGNLYPVLHRLEKDGLLESRLAEVGEEKTKKVYSLTKAGRKELANEKNQFQAFIGAYGKMMGSET